MRKRRVWLGFCANNNTLNISPIKRNLYFSGNYNSLFILSILFSHIFSKGPNAMSWLSQMTCGDLKKYIFLAFKIISDSTKKNLLDLLKQISFVNLPWSEPSRDAALLYPTLLYGIILP